MKITYINHSSFCVELDNCILLFDYFKGNLPYFDKNKKLYIFASHHHEDHFNPVIFDLESTYKNIKYILSDDIKNTKSKNIKFVKPNQNIIVDNLKISTLESSDLGVAFFIEVEGKRIYHAGDLNWWHWEGENPSSNEDAALRFNKEINKIKGTTFDIAFLPLDPRQENKYYLGFDTFMKNTNTKVAFPMHCWGDYSFINKLKNEEFAICYKNKIIEIKKENEVFSIF